MSMAPGQPLVRIRNLRFRYPGADHDVLRIPSLDIRGLGLTALTGPSGAGKSTLVELLAGTLREQYDGTVEILGQDWRAIAKDSDRQRLLRRVGLIPQDYGFISGRSVRQALTQDLADAQVPRPEQVGRIEAALKEVGLGPFADREVNRLSGGQRQRVAIARMLAREIDLVIADEPTANLDPELVEDVMTLLRRLGERVPVIVVTHDSHVASLCDRTVLMQPSAPYEAAPTPEAVPRAAGRSRALVAAGTVMLAVLLLAAAGLALSKLNSRTNIAGGRRPTPSSSAPTLVAPIASCVARGQTTGGGQPIAQPSGSVTLPTAAPASAKLTAYSDGITTVLAPAGWSCTSGIGADGVDTVTAVPKGENAQAPSQIVTGGQDSASGGLVYTDICNYFFKISGDPQYDCPPPPNGELTQRLSEWAVQVEDVPGSGVVPLAPNNANPIESVVIFTVSTAIHERCALPQKDVCNFILATLVITEKPITKVHIFQPAPDARGTSSSQGSCFAESIAAPRVGAFRCMEGNSIIDPCFIRVDGVTLLCNPDPTIPSSGILFHLSAAPTAGASGMPSMPWEIHLQDGRQCGVVTGTTVPGAPYGCGSHAPFTNCQAPTIGPHEDLQTVCGPVDPSGQGITNASRIAIVEAWY